jgi:hypothetical protein
LTSKVGRIRGRIDPRTTKNNLSPDGRSLTIMSIFLVATENQV